MAQFEDAAPDAPGCGFTVVWNRQYGIVPPVVLAGDSVRAWFKRSFWNNRLRCAKLMRSDGFPNTRVVRLKCPAGARALVLNARRNSAQWNHPSPIIAAGFSHSADPPCTRGLRDGACVSHADDRGTGQTFWRDGQ